MHAVEYCCLSVQSTLCTLQQRGTSQAAPRAVSNFLKTTADGRRYLEYCEEPEINKEG